jgi:hypothetical protein
MILVEDSQEMFLRLEYSFRSLTGTDVFHLDALLFFLTKADRNSWELPTSQVQLLVGVKPRGTTFSRYGFTFRPAGKHGQETSWRVER